MSRRIVLWMAAAAVFSGCGDSDRQTRNEPRSNPSVQEMPPSDPRSLIGIEIKESDLLPVLKATRARLIVATIWAPGCGGCIQEAIELSELKAAWAKKGAAVIGLGFAEDEEECRQFFESTGRQINYPLYRAPWAFEKYGVELTPTIVLLTPEGEVLMKVTPLDAGDPLALVEKKIDEDATTERTEVHRGKSVQD